MKKTGRHAKSPSLRAAFGARRLLASMVALAFVVTTSLVFTPSAMAGTDDYPAVWRNAPIDSVLDTWLEYNRECTSFVAWRLHSRSGYEMPFHDDADGWGAKARARGITVDTIPSVGAIAWWSYGHLAWVESVNPGGTVTTEEYNWRIGTTGEHDGAYHRRTIAASAPTGYIHFKDAGSALHDNLFVLHRGDVFRMAGGAPLYVSSWATYGGEQPLITLSDARWAALPQYPADGTYLLGKPSGQVFKVLGGAPVYVSNWATFGGEQPTVAVGDDVMRNAGTTDAAKRWTHLRYHPADGTLLAAQPSGQVFRIAGGAPNYVPTWESIGGWQPTQTIGEDAIAKAGTADPTSPWSHLRARLSGPDRYATSAAISADAFAPGVSVAYVANGQDFPDALSGAPVAGKAGAPVLLVQADSIPAVVQAELTRLRPERIVVLGGENSVAGAVATRLGAFTAGAVTRLSGPDRFATSAAISRASFSPGVPVVYLANAYNFPDALSGAPVAAGDNAPVLLVQTDAIAPAIRTELARLRPGRIVVLGGENSVSTAVAAELAGLGTAGVSRLAGPDRFATSAAISAASFKPGAPVVYLTNGHNFPDALSGAPVAGTNRAPVLLVQSDVIPAVIQAELKRLKPARIVVLGGENSVSSAILP